ncbi:hypothetical protein [Hoeflea sp.]|uniref:hypothetical protein n=1 Tax=Hoeflea sp. TaxID=1940281 RepID=UPI0025C33D0E|nr:hypothetical protein [Hoeflea sp.]
MAEFLALPLEVYAAAISIAVGAGVIVGWFYKLYRWARRKKTTLRKTRPETK